MVMQVFPIRLADNTIVGPLQDVPDDFMGWSVERLSQAGIDPEYTHPRWAGIGFWPPVDTPPEINPKIQTRTPGEWVPNPATKTVMRQYTIASIPAAEVLEAKLEALAAYRYAKEIAGTQVTLAGQSFALKTDRESKALVDQMYGVLKDGTIASAKFKTAEGKTVIADTVVAGAIRAALAVREQALRSKEVDHMDAMKALDAAGNTAGVADYDFTAGWPV